ncbi:MAG: CPBP family intramembrane metalloprotease [Bacteroidota bacterium]|nr:CPBP family intramembrane metalloprotease [Bacteroidota bacterium]MDP4195678.1 CPBP family intramembrane metalloprotease [Bacteroidota bacterium]
MENFKPEENNPAPFDQKDQYTDDGKRPEISPRISPLTASFLGLLSVFFLYQVGGSLLTYLILGFNLKNADVISIRLLTMAGQLLFILLPALLFTRYIYFDVTQILRFRLPDLSGVLLFTAGLLCLTPLLESYLYIQNAILIKLSQIYPSIFKMKEFVDKIDKLVEESYSSILASHSVPEGLMIIVVVAVVPAICEEIFFRGFVQKGFEFKLKPFTSALITAIFFGLYHFHPYQIVPLTALGLYFGYAVYLSDSIFTSIFLHFLNNLFAVIMFFIYGSEDIATPKTFSASELTTSVMVFTGLSVLFSLIIIYIKKVYYIKRLN